MLPDHIKMIKYFCGVDKPMHLDRMKTIIKLVYIRNGDSFADNLPNNVHDVCFKAPCWLLLNNLPNGVKSLTFEDANYEHDGL